LYYLYRSDFHNYLAFEFLFDELDIVSHSLFNSACSFGNLQMAQTFADISKTYMPIVALTRTA